MRIRKPRGLSSPTIFLGCALGFAATYYTWYPLIQAQNELSHEKKTIADKIGKELQEKKTVAAASATLNEK